MYQSNFQTTDPKSRPNQPAGRRFQLALSLVICSAGVSWGSVQPVVAEAYSLRAPNAPNACSLVLSDKAIPGGSKVVDFDDVNNTIGTHYAITDGLTFENLQTHRALAIPDNDVNNGNTPHARSSPNVAINSVINNNTDFTKTLSFDFAEGKSFVGFYLGNGEGTNPTASLSAFDALGAQICTGQVSNVPEFHTLFAGFSDPDARIRRVSIDYGQTFLAEAIDDLTYFPAPIAQSSGNIAYVYNGAAAPAASFKSLLESRGYTVTLVAVSALTSTILSGFDLFILADDSGRYPGDGEWFTWGTSAANTAAQMAPLIAQNKPIIALGEGGSTYLERRGLSIGWLHAWYRTGDDDLSRAPLTSAGAVFGSPNAMPADPIRVYTSNGSSLNVFGPRMSSSAVPIGMEVPDNQHFSMAYEGCHFTWGFRDDPTNMTSDGRNLFHNLVNYAMGFSGQCPPVQPIESCLAVSKSANPVNGAPVPVSNYGIGRYSLITYTLNYTVSTSPNCGTTGAQLLDVVPQGTQFAPGSASDGATPDPTGQLTWPLTTASGSKQFSVLVEDSACQLENGIRNRARIRAAGTAAIESNEVTHSPRCLPIVGDNESPSFAQDELSVYPYPIIAGRMHTLSVRLINNTITDTVATVRFRTSSEAFGIGIPFTSIATRTVTIPAFGRIIVEVPVMFFRSGHLCIGVAVDVPGYETFFSSRNLDVMEDLRPGVPDVLPFRVANPMPFTTDVHLEVDNACPGFTSVVSPAFIPAMAPGAVITAQLTTTPPNPVVLGSGCHIDVQGYVIVGGRRVPMPNGGLRKLDVPPVQVSNPPGTAPWSSPLITFEREPLRAGVPNSICIEIQNPLPVTKVVTLTFQVANFGAGIGFSPVATRVVELPPNSIQRYCVSWTPPAQGHYCVEVTVQLPGYRPAHVQRNVDVEPPFRLDLTIPILIGNPDLISHTLTFDIEAWGIHPDITPVIVIPRPGGGGDPAPREIGPGQQINAVLAFRRFVSASGARRAQGASAVGDTFGDVQRVDVAVKLSGKTNSGFSVQFQTVRIFLPLMRRS